MASETPPSPPPPAAPTPPSFQQKIPVSIQDRDADQLPRLRDERHHRARDPGRARRPEARPPAHPLLAQRAEDRPDGRAQEVRQVVGDVLGKYHPHGDATRLRRHGPPGPALLDALPAHRRAGQLRLRRRRPRPPPYATPRRASPASRPSCSPTSKRRPSTSGPTTTTRARSRSSSRRASRTSSSTARAASRSAWPPTSRRTTWARSSTPPSTSSSNPDATIDDLMRFVPGPDFPTGGLIYGRSGIEQAQRTGRGADRHARAHPGREVARQAATASRSSSPRCPTR